MSPFVLRHRVAHRRRWATLALAATIGVAVPSTAPPLLAADEAAPAAIDDQDLIFLSLSFRNQAKDYLAKPDASERVRAIYDESTGMARRGRRHRRAVPQARRGVQPDDARELGRGRLIETVLDLRLPAKLYQPGEKVEARLFSIWERPERFSTHYMVSLQLVGPDGKESGTPSHAHLSRRPPWGRPRPSRSRFPRTRRPVAGWRATRWVRITTTVRSRSRCWWPSARSSSCRASRTG